MGGSIAARLLEKGIPVLAYDPNRGALARMQALGGLAAESVRQVGNEAHIVLACLPDARICREVALGAQGLAGSARAKIYVETSTIGRRSVMELGNDLSRHGITLLDCPVVGGTVALKAGTLGVLASGPRSAFEEARMVLDAFAGRLFYLGENAGMGQAGKVVNNAVAYAAFLATCEAVAIAMKGGIDMETAVAIINQGSGMNFFSQYVFPQFLLQGKFAGSGPIEIGIKDVEQFLAEARELGIETPVATAISALQARIAAAGEPGRDTMTVFHFFTDLASLARQG
jgi:3-hydroxyisobutyrate dehydrogenase-like beta-hydroxyacid dehydrogenase